MLWWTLRKLRSNDELRRLCAAEELGRAHDTRAVAALVATLETDKWDHVRTAAARALGEIGDGRAADALLEAFKTNNTELRREAANALAAIGWQPRAGLAGAEAERVALAVAREDWDAVAAAGEAAVEPLLAELQRQKVDKEAITRALASLGPKAVEPMLEWSADARRPELVSKVLAGMGSAVVELLVSALSDARKAEAAAMALDALGWEPPDDAQRAQRLVALHKWDDALALGAAAVEPLIAAWKGFCDRHWFAYAFESELAAIARALGGTRDVRAVAPLLACLPRIGHAPKAEREIILALDRIKQADAAAAGLILAGRQHRDSVEITRSLLSRLSWRRTDAPALVEALRDEDEGVRYWAAVGLRGAGGSEVVEPLIAALKDRGEFVIGGPASFSTGSSTQVFFGSSSSRYFVRAAAARALGALGDVRAVEALQELAANDRAAEVRAAAAEAVEQLVPARP